MEAEKKTVEDFTNTDEFGNTIGPTKVPEGIESVAVILKTKYENRLIGTFYRNDKNNNYEFNKGVLRPKKGKDKGHLMEKYKNSVGINYAFVKLLSDDDIVFFKYKEEIYWLYIKNIKNLGTVACEEKKTGEVQIFVPLVFWTKKKD